MKTLQAEKVGEISSGGRGKGSLTLQKLVTKMHGDDVDEQVWKMALEPFMEEVLCKLAEDGRVAFEMRARVKRWFVIA